MNYSLFYNYKLMGDVLMVIFENDLIPTSKVEEDDFIKIYHGEK